MKRLLACLLLCACARREPPPVILISIDTLRADAVSRATTPHLEAFGREGLVFRNAWSHVPLTLPSHLSMLTGLLPPEHGVRDNAGYRFDAALHPTLAALLRAHGYRTGAAVSAYVLRAATGVASGFEQYEDAIGVIEGAALGALWRRGTITEKIAERWIDEHDREPFFFFLHLYEPHTPYEPTYARDVASADAIVGAFLRHLQERGVYDRALIVIASDHGEGLNDHGEKEHGVFVYAEDLRVPLMIKAPRRAHPGSVERAAQLIDIAPTILDAAGVAAPRSMRGVSLLRGIPDGRAIYGESFYPRMHFGWAELRSLVSGGRHAIDAPRGELYDVVRDPREKTDLASGDRRTFTRLRELARAIAGEFRPSAQVDPEEAAKLAALGYLSAGAEASSAPLHDPKDGIAELVKLRAVADLRVLAGIIAGRLPRCAGCSTRIRDGVMCARISRASTK